MKKLYRVLLGLFLLTGILSCEYLEEDLGLSTEEVVEGLKKALEIGADSSTSKLSAVDGYYADAAVKILLPPEAEIITNNLDKLPAIKSLVEPQMEKLLLSINRAAEDAADDALPILSDAITSLSIQDGWDILNGTVPGGAKSALEENFDSLAATNYMEQQTRQDLLVVFSTPMNASLQKPLVGNVSTYSLWNDVTSTYNQAAAVYNSTIGLFGTELETVDTDIGEFVTGKALDGLFFKVGQEEKKIRRNPWQWAVDIIQKVFGSLQD